MAPVPKEGSRARWVFGVSWLLCSAAARHLSMENCQSISWEKIPPVLIVYAKTMERVLSNTQRPHNENHLLWGQKLQLDSLLRTERKRLSTNPEMSPYPLVKSLKASCFGVGVLVFF